MNRDYYFQGMKTCPTCSQAKWVIRLSRVVRHYYEAFTRTDDDRLGQVHPTMIAHDGGGQLSQPFTGRRFDLEDRNFLSGFDPLQMKSGDDSVIAKPEREVPFVEEWDYGEPVLSIGSGYGKRF